MKRGIFALSKIAELILILIALVLLIFLIYFLRDKIVEFVKIIFKALGP